MRQFPFDEVCEKIVCELEKRNWNVPDVRVEFGENQSGEEKSRVIQSVTGKNFYINFCRGKDTASEIIIPRKELHVYNDESGPTLYVYVGKNWEKDENDFFCGTKNMAKYYKKPRTYLVYSGITYGCRSNILKNNTDLDREYGLLSGDKEFYKTSDVFNEFDKWLNENVLKYVLSQPVGEKIEETIEILPVPKEFKTLYSLVDLSSVAEIKSKRFGLRPSLRLISLDCHSHGDLSIPKKAYDGFIWCKLTDIFEFRREYCVAKVSLKNINDVYIADLSGGKKYRQSIFESDPNKKCLTDAEYEEYRLIPGRTLIPLCKYKGGFEEPIILVNRDLGLDEVFLN